MSKSNQFIETFRNNYSERYFNPKETLQWLHRNKIISMSWGYHNPKALTKDDQTTGLIFRVNGHLHKGFVLITLAWNDTYTLRFFNMDYDESKKCRTNVYCDELQEVIDYIIEKIPEYSN